MPSSMTPHSALLPCALAPQTVAIISAASAGSAFGSPVLPLAMSAAALISSNRSRLLLDATESVPRQTFIPAFTMPSTSAQPEASFRLLTGQCAADTWRLASSCISSCVTWTQCAATVGTSNTWWQSSTCAGVRPYFSTHASCSFFVSDRCTCNCRPLLTAYSASASQS